jgi:hypothetical protein
MPQENIGVDASANRGSAPFRFADNCVWIGEVFGAFVTATHAAADTFIEAATRLVTISH